MNIRISLDTSLNKILYRYLAQYDDNYFEPIIQGGHDFNFPVLSTADWKNIQVMKWCYPGKKEKLYFADAYGIVKHPYFYKNIRQTRCLIPVTSFSIQDNYFTVNDYDIFSLAGVFTSLQSDTGIEHSFAIITVPANAVIKKYSKVMPVILSKSREQEWIKPGTVLSRVTSLMRPYDDHSTLVNNNNPYWRNIPDKKPSEMDMRRKKSDNDITGKPFWQRGSSKD